MIRRVMSHTWILGAALVLLEVESLIGPLESAVLQAVVGLPLAFILPGALLGRALTDRPQGPRAADDLVVALGLSLSILAVGGVILDLFDFGLRPMSWVIYIAAVLAAAEAVRHMRGHEPNRLDFTFARSIDPRVPLVVLAVAALIGGAFAIAVTGAERQEGPRVTQLWITPRASPGTYQIGVASYNGQSSSFTLDLREGGRKVRSWRFGLSRGQSWQAVLRPPPGTSVRATLFRRGDRSPYRQVFIRSNSF